MNILFIYSLQDLESLNRPLASPEYLQFGISYISAFLKSNGYKTRLAVLSRFAGVKRNHRVLDKYINDFKPGLICFTAVSSEYRFISDIAKFIKKKYKDIYLLIGGVHVSLNPEEALLDGFDALCIGEGEHPTLELARCLENKLSPSHIHNLWIKNDGSVEKNPTRPFLEDLDSLPNPDREMWQEWIFDQPNSRQAVILGRGCPFICSYCSNHAIRKTSAGRYVRVRSVNNIIEEIKELAKKYPQQKEIYLEIETFYVDKKWAIELCLKLEELNKGLTQPLSFGVNLRIMPNVDYEELFKACKKTNFRFINIGIESGNERIRREVLKRDYLNQDVIKVVKLARQYGLKVAFFNLVGIPTETPSDFRETVRINRICMPNWTNTSIFFPYPGTELYSMCKEKGFLIKKLDTVRERDRAILELPGFSKKMIQKSYEWFYFDIYRGSRPMVNLLMSVIIMKLRSRPRLFYLYKIFSRSKIYKYLRIAARAVSKDRISQGEPTYEIQ